MAAGGEDVWVKAMLKLSKGLAFFFFLNTLHGMQDLSSLSRDRTHAPCSGSMES